jgi:site-specific recombinase
VSDVRGRLRDIERLADLIAAMVRSQIAAILGNVVVALPVAIAIGAGLAWWKGAPVVDAGKAFHLLADLDPLRSLAIPHAAIAGVYLFLAGLISGSFDNLAAYGRLGERIAALRWLRAVIGKSRAARFGAWVDRNLGGLAGNFFFGIFLGATATVGFLFGLPLDIRHIAFAAANFGYALHALDFNVPAATLAWSALGVVLIGVTNLTVSFVLALWVALKSHDVEFRRTGDLFRLLGRRVLRQPGLFLLPPRATASPAG